VELGHHLLPASEEVENDVIKREVKRENWRR
jgi:hypothetical protein